MKRYYVCRIYGDGNIDVPLTPTTGPYRPAIHDIVDPDTGLKAFSITAQIGLTSNGTPARNWCIVIAGGADHTLATGNDDIDQLPDISLDSKLSSIPSNIKNAILQKLQNRGIDVSSISNNDAYRLLIRLIGRLQDSNFHEDKFNNVE